MRIVNVAGGVALTLACLIVGVRLVLLARRTRQLPELIVGIAFLSGGVIGYTLSWTTALLPLPDTTRDAVGIGVRFFVAGGCASILYVAWRVFRPGAAWAAVLFGFVLALLGLYVFRDLLFARRVGPDELAWCPLYWAGAVGHVTPYAWATWESFAYQAAIRRRVALGLPGSRAVAARTALWAVGLGATGLIYVAIHVVDLIAAVSGARPDIAPLVSALGLVCAGALGLAFFPPQVYVRRLEERG